MKPQLADNEKDLNPADTGGCSVCRELLANLGRFYEMLEAIRSPCPSDWLTVEDVAQELKISKSIVYRLIRSGELEAVDLVVGDEGKPPGKDTFGYGDPPLISTSKPGRSNLCRTHLFARLPAGSRR